MLADPWHYTATSKCWQLLIWHVATVTLTIVHATGFTAGHHLIDPLLACVPWRKSLWLEQYALCLETLTLKGAQATDLGLRVLSKSKNIHRNIRGKNEKNGSGLLERRISTGYSWKFWRYPSINPAGFVFLFFFFFFFTTNFLGTFPG